MLTNHVFLLKMTNPVNINGYLLPNAIQWNYTQSTELKSININLFNSAKVKPLETALFSDEYDVIRVRIDWGLFYYLVTMSDVMHDNMISTFNLKTEYDCVLLYGCAFNYLFKYQPRVIQAIESLQTELDLETGKFVALHVRTHIDDNSVFNPLYLKFPYKPMFECAAMAARSLSHKLNVSKVPIFLATDHPSVTKFAEENYKKMLVFSSAPKFHTDKTKYTGSSAKGQYNDGMIGVLSDIEIGSRAAVLIRSADSTFSEVMGAIHFLKPEHNLHPFYFYENETLCNV